VFVRPLAPALVKVAHQRPCCLEPGPDRQLSRSGVPAWRQTRPCPRC